MPRAAVATAIKELRSKEVKVSLLLLFFHKSFDWRLKNGAHGEALGGCGLAEFTLVMPGDAADKADGKVRTTIGQDVLPEEIAEIADDKLADGLIVEVAVDEL